VTAHPPARPVRSLWWAARRAAYGTTVVGTVRAVSEMPGGCARRVGAWLVTTLLVALAAPLVGPGLARWTSEEAELLRSRQRLLAAEAGQRARFSAAVAAHVQRPLADADAALRAAAEGDPAGLGRAREATREALTALRDLAAGTYPAALAAHGLGAALECHLLRVRPQVALHAGPAAAGRGRLGAIEETAYFCVVTLVDEPGEGDPVAVRLTVADDALAARVEYRRAPGPENLRLTRDRAEAAGGGLRFAATADGWTATVHLPLDRVVTEPR
jgi:hypothetical protein